MRLLTNVALPLQPGISPCTTCTPRHTQDELLGHSEQEEWAPYTAAVDSDVLYMTGEDKQVCADDGDTRPDATIVQNAIIIYI